MPEQLLLTAKPHDNHYLFSDYYLDNRVSGRPKWSEVDVRSDYEKLVELWALRKSALAHANESQTEADWIRPVLQAGASSRSATIPTIGRCWVEVH